MKGDPFAAARNAVSNGSLRQVEDAEIKATLASGDGAGHVVRALFGDCAAETLLAMAMQVGVTRDDLKAAYVVARRKHLAANEAMDALVENSLT